MMEKSTRQTSLTKFKDCLRMPIILRPHKTDDQRYILRIHMRPAQVQLHSELPPSEVWTYEGSLPGPTIEVARGQSLQVEWINAIPGGEPYPITAVTAPDGTQNEPGRSGRQANSTVAKLSPWTVVHLHGGRTAAVSDGWTENASLSGQSTTSDYTNDQQATLLWYHDHAMGITRFNVYAGLAGLYIIRDAEEAALHLPAGPYEIPLLLQDRNLETAPDGSLTGRLLHKVENGTMEFFGPFTLVNGTIWPHLPVEARQYRLRLLNGSNARIYRLVLLDESGTPVHELIKQIGTDGGLLGQPVEIPRDGLLLAPAERADLIVDFRALQGQRLILVNTAGAPFDNSPATQPPGTPDPENRLPHPEVMEFRVSSQPVDDPFVLPTSLSSSYRRLEHDRLPPAHQHRVVAMVEYPDGMLTFHELAEVPDGVAAAGEELITIADEQGKTRRYRTIARHFEDTVNWFVAYGSTEVWSVVNLTEDTHPFHVHLVQFQALGRDLYNTEGFQPETRATTVPIRFQGHGTLDANELGWKDTVRVNPGEMVSIVATFDGFTGRYMYHCHILEHEDHDMMRPFIVMPAAALAAMDMPGMSM
ncbi:MAG: multicopper oxidase family protein [Chloroflexi bacterium]|nr:MAG: multicopper oxidase family protein [Chloroflexota bacterium]